MVHEWSFGKLVCITTGGQEKVVTLIPWTLTATDGGFSAAYAGATSIAYDGDPASFVPYADLTKDLVASWVEAALLASGDATVETILAQLDDEVARKKASATEALAVPWA
jgi:hypothetical protein